MVKILWLIMEEMKWFGKEFLEKIAYHYYH